MKFPSKSFGLCGHLGVPGNPGNLTTGIYEMQLSLVLSLSLPPPFSDVGVSYINLLISLVK